jgi:hypothetical protein
MKMTLYAKMLEWMDWNVSGKNGNGLGNEYTRKFVLSWVRTVTMMNKKNPGWAIWRAIEVIV